MLPVLSVAVGVAGENDKEERDEELAGSRVPEELWAGNERHDSVGDVVENGCSSVNARQVSRLVDDSVVQENTLSRVLGDEDGYGRRSGSVLPYMDEERSSTEKKERKCPENKTKKDLSTLLLLGTACFGQSNK